MTSTDRNVLELLGDALDLVLRRACADDNAADALAVVRDAVARWADGGLTPDAVLETLRAALDALRLTDRDAPAGTFEERYSRER